MLTAVQLRVGFDIRSWLFAGTPLTIVPGTLGEIALLPPECVAAYEVEWGGTARLILFRTAPSSPTALSRVAGISPAVEILLQIARRRRITRVERVLRGLQRRGIRLEDLPPAFWGRLGAVALLRESIRQPVIGDLLTRSGIATRQALRRRRFPPG